MYKLFLILSNFLWSLVKVDQDVKIKSKEKTKKTTSKKTGIIAKPGVTDEAFQEDALEEKLVKKTVTRRNTATEVTEPKSKKRKANPSVNRKDEAKLRQKKEQTSVANEDEIITDALVNNEISIKENSTLEMIDKNDTKDLSEGNNMMNNKEDSMNKDFLNIKSPSTEIERSATFLCL